MDLHATDGNPVPASGQAGAIATVDGVTLRFARFTPADRPRGTVCVVGGRGETIERYFETIADILARGFAVATFDWRGQGGSDRRLRDRRRDHVDSFSEYDRDLEAFFDQVVLPDCPPPHFALAHSMGALVCLRGARAGRVRFQRMVLAAPLVALGPQRPRQRTACRIAALVTALGLGELPAPGPARRTLPAIPFEGNLLTGDAARFRRNVAIARAFPALQVAGPTYGWINAACMAMREAGEADFAPAVRAPTLIVVGGLDTVVSVGAIEGLGAELRTGSVMVIPGGLHELLMERDAVRSQFFAAFDAFIPGTAD
jgi:lysophospholipase